MKPFTRRGLILSIGGITLVVLLAVMVVLGSPFSKNTRVKLSTSSDINKAKGLSSLSGLSKEKILKIYDSITDWERIQENIFVYHRVLSLVNEDSPDYEEVFNVIGKYKANDILTIYEFLAVNAPNFKQAEGLLKKHANGSTMESLSTEVVETRKFKVYKPADKTLVRSWLTKGYSPEDILAADNVAQAKDLKIEEVLSLKNKATSWEEVGRKLGYEFPKNSQAMVTMSFQGTAGTQSFTGKDYETIVKEANSKAEKEGTALEEKITRDSGLTSNQITEYKKQGFSIWDIHNASLLSKKSGGSLDRILAERKNGLSWEQILERDSR